MSPVPGQLKRSLQGYRTFVPDPLPPALSLPASIRRKVEDATHLLGKVDMCKTLLPNANLLIYRSLQREALASSTIEGTIASPDELVRYQVSHQTDRQDVREVNNYRVALEWGLEMLQQRPLATVLILGLHERLLDGVRGSANAGRFKDKQNYIGANLRVDIRDAEFVPASPQDVPDLIQALDLYINNPDNDEEKVVQCALTHYQFETIHPFHDGNGRVGRLMIILQMIQLGLLSAPLIYPSVYFERRRSEYYQRLQDVRDIGAWENWVDFFAEGIRQQCLETLTFTTTILDLREQVRSGLGDIRRRAALQAVLDTFFYEPLLSVNEISQRASMSQNAVQSALNTLQDRELVIEMTGRQRGRVYGCRPLLQAIFGSGFADESPARITDE